MSGTLACLPNQYFNDNGSPGVDDLSFKHLSDRVCGEIQITGSMLTISTSVGRDARQHVLPVGHYPY